MPAKPADRGGPDYLTPVIYHTLLALARGPKHGYAISQEVADLTGGRISMGPGTLYGTLQRLTDNGWLRRTETVDAEAPHAERRRYYELTPSGRAVLRVEARRLARAVELARERAVLRGS
jgi:DNA-binding PadR family transcriptional regulator